VRKSLFVLVSLVIAVVVVAGVALGGSTTPPSVGGAMAELGCSPATSQTSLDGAHCRLLAQTIFRFDQSAANVQSSVQQLGEAQDALAANLDSLGELNSEQALALQQAMERRAQFLEALSNLLKKQSDTQNQIVQNLKG
jgi:hypothetical protein